jgi:hypothetical protein
MWLPSLCRAAKEAEKAAQAAAKAARLEVRPTQAWRIAAGCVAVTHVKILSV